MARVSNMGRRKLKLLIAQHRWWFPTAMSGADLANHEMAYKMVEHGIEVRVHGILPPGESRRVQRREYTAAGIPVSLVKSDFLKHLRQKIEEFKPDVVLTTCPEPNVGEDDISRMIDVIGNYDVPALLYVHDLVSTLPLFEGVKDRLAAVVTNSRFMVGRIRALWQIASDVVYPVPDWPPLFHDNPGGPFITFFTPLPHKGLDIAQALVTDRFSNRPFLFVEGLIDPEEHGISLVRTGNLVHARRSPDIATIYSMSRIVIIPSQWEEPFGRIALEAMHSRVPVIASRTGGLPESVGDGGILIDDYASVDRWVEAIESLSDPKERRRIIATGKRHVKNFSLEDQVAAFIEIMRRVA